MSRTYDIIRGSAVLLAFVVAMGWFFWRWLKGARDPAALVFRWILSAIAFCGLLFAGTLQGYGQLFGILISVICGLFLAIVWVPVITDFVGRKFGSLYDGGDAEVEPQPFYSIAQTKRKQGKYLEAVAEIRKQLDRFPGDFEGSMMLAEIQAEQLNDLPGAELTVQRLCEHPGRAPMNIAYALNHLADWHLKLTQDPEAARHALEKIIELLPDTEMSLQAAQRIGRLADTKALLEPHDRRKFFVGDENENVGLLASQSHLRPGEADPEKLAAEYVRHLEQHPLDTYAREKLAAIYADHYQRLDLAAGQLEQLIQQPNQPARLVTHWLNLLADLQVKHGAGVEEVRNTLQRILDLDPSPAVAENTRRRLDILKLELKAKEAGRTVKLGSYEQNVGLRKRNF